MSSFLKIIGMVNLTKDPELRYTTSGTAVAAFSAACNYRIGKGDTAKDEPCFIDCVVFGNRAEAVAQHFSKGDSIIIDGDLHQDRWEADDGTKRSKHKVIVRDWKFGPKRKGTTTNPTDDARADAMYGQPPASQNDGPPDFTDDDIPF